jgi:hypothetical protein
MTAVAVATLTSGNEQRYAETAAVSWRVLNLGYERIPESGWPPKSWSGLYGSRFVL